MKPLEGPTFYPTKADMAGSFEKYIESIEKKVSDIGICKIVAPKVRQASEHLRLAHSPKLLISECYHAFPLLSVGTSAKLAEREACTVSDSFGTQCRWVPWVASDAPVCIFDCLAV